MDANMDGYAGRHEGHRRAAVRTRAASRENAARRGTPRASGLVLALLRVLLRGFGKLGIGFQLLDRLVLITLVHRLLEPAHGGSEIGTDRLELLGPEDQQDDDQDDNEFFEAKNLLNSLV